MAKWVVVDTAGELAAGSSVSLPKAGNIQLGKGVKGSTEALQAELDEFYPGRFQVQLQ
jgi:hypothetical protein